MLTVLLLLVQLLARPFSAAEYDALYMRRALVKELQTQRDNTVADSACAVASAHHARYLSSTRTLSHYEEIQGSVPLRYSINERGVDAEICLSYKAHSDFYDLTYEELAQKMVSAFLASPDHKEILLEPTLRKMAASVAYNPKDDTFYAVVTYRH